ncbi:lactonase family protein [Lachnospiraceae bacterium 54-53]
MKQFFCVGTYTEPILFGTGEVFQGKGKGISICALENGEIKTISSISVRNPSFLCVDKKRKKIYAVNEMKEYMDAYGGGVTQVSYDNSWNMELEATCNIGGLDPCHILLALNSEFLSIANFASGSVTVVPLDKNGTIDTEHMRLFQHEGESVHPVRQKGPHAHATIEAPDRKLLYVPDLGTDTVYAYRYEGKAVEPDPVRQLSVPAGSGPRTGIFSKQGSDFYLICEISSQVIHYKYENGAMVRQETVSTLPTDNTVENICSDIHLTPDGAYLYASNRGHDSIASFRVCGDGSLKFVERQSCRGKTPRNFAIDPMGKYLLCGNQDSDTISIFEIKENGTLAFKKEEFFETPVCIRFFGSLFGDLDE